jgi:hypothetical protein
MSPSDAQLFAQAAQMSAQTPQTRAWNSDSLSMKFAHVWHISAQSRISRKWTGSTCFPPIVRQCVIAIERQVR